MTEYLDTQSPVSYLYSHYRRFDPDEKHITRTCQEDVLLLMLDGVLRFEESGVPVELRAGEYYIQKRGLFQCSGVPSDTPYYYYAHFAGSWTSEGGIPRRGTFGADIPPLAQRLSELVDVNASLLEKSAVFYDILSRLKYSPVLTAGQRLAAQIRQSIHETSAAAFPSPIWPANTTYAPTTSSASSARPIAARRTNTSPICASSAQRG